MSSSDPVPAELDSTRSNGTEYYCHTCDITTSVLVSPQGEPLCTACGDSFVEKLNDGAPSLAEFNNGTNAPDLETTIPDDIQESLDEFFGRIFRTYSGNAVADEGQTRSAMPPIRPTLVHIGRPHFQIQGSGNIGASSLTSLARAFFEPAPTRGLGPRTIGDYAFGDISGLIEQLMRDDPNRHGAPPASVAFINGLSVITIEHGSSYIEQECSVCMEKYETGDKIRKLPCGHAFHSPDCIIPWLQQHATCPTCRLELPTDDATQMTPESNSESDPNRRSSSV